MKYRYKLTDEKVKDVACESDSPIEKWGFGTEVVVKRDDYPYWICQECAESLGHKNRCEMSTYHPDICGWCNEMKTVTEPRDYSYPPFSKNKCHIINK